MLPLSSNIIDFALDDAGPIRTTQDMSGYGVLNDVEVDISMNAGF
jgi:hypothetical protein